MIMLSMLAAGLLERLRHSLDICGSSLSSSALPFIPLSSRAVALTTGRLPVVAFSACSAMNELLSRWTGAYRQHNGLQCELGAFRLQCSAVPALCPAVRREQTRGRAAL